LNDVDTTKKILCSLLDYEYLDVQCCTQKTPPHPIGWIVLYVELQVVDLCRD